MENLVLYRKYRPKTFGEVMGQEHVVKTLTNALQYNKVAHAYLFTGPRGTGKTTIARLLAKTVNCTNLVGEERAGTNLSVRRSIAKADKGEPCNRCASCQQINEGRAMDLIEIDAASNRGIDEIRELREGVRFSPSFLKYKVFIIDEVHQLTKEAFNALLKTLEEPPAHAIFILATTEIHKVPQTIISRCQRFDFHKLTLPQIVERLASMSKDEKIKVSKEALELIAQNADGAMRDAESLLGQIMALEDKNITLEEVQTILGTVNIGAVIDLVELMAKKDKKGAIELINKLVEEGYDLSEFSKSLVRWLRKALILRVDEKLMGLVAPDLTQEQKAVILAQGKAFEEKHLIQMIKLFAEAGNEVKSSILPQLPLELVIVEVLN